MYRYYQDISYKTGQIGVGGNVGNDVGDNVGAEVERKLGSNHCTC